MTEDIVDPGLAAPVLDTIDLDRAVDIVRQVCRIPSVLGEEGELAAFLASVMRGSGFESVGLQPVLPGRPNAIGEVSFGAGRRVVLTGHMDTKPVSHGWQRAAPFSGEVIDGAVYGHGVMDMKAALACQIVAIEAVRASGLPLSGTLAMAAVSDHMGDQLGSIAYFDAHEADLCVLGELTDNEVCLGHRGRYYFDVTVLGRSAHTCHKHAAINANVLAAQAVLALDRSRLEPALPEGVAELFGAETYIVPGRIYGGLPPGGPSMIPDECVIRVDCRPQPGVSTEQVRAEIDRCLTEAAAADDRMLPVGNACLQLLEATGPGVIERFLDRRGPGLHHVAFEVSDLDSAVADLGGRGVRLLDKAARPGGMGTRIAFIHPAACGGLLIELVESPSAGSAGPADPTAERSQRGDAHS